MCDCESTDIPQSVLNCKCTAKYIFYTQLKNS